MHFLFALVTTLALVAVANAREPVLQAARRALARSLPASRLLQPRWIDQPAQCVGCAARFNESACLESCSCGWCHASPGVGAHCLDIERANEEEQWRPGACSGAWDTDAGSNDCRVFSLATVQALAATLGFSAGVLVLYVLTACCFCCCCSKKQRRQFKFDELELIDAGSGGALGEALAKRGHGHKHDRKHDRKRDKHTRLPK